MFREPALGRLQEHLRIRAPVRRAMSQSLIGASELLQVYRGIFAGAALKRSSSTVSDSSKAANPGPSASISPPR
jgi:hypothetical protein